MIIAFAGQANSGKDTAALYLVKRHNFVKYGFADPLKRGLNAMFGWQPHQWLDREWKEQDDPMLGFSPRKAAQTLGTEWGRKMLRDDLWVQVATIFHEGLQKLGQGMVISDLRYDNEAEWVKARGGKIIVLLRRVAGIQTELKEHSSEKGISEKLVDFYLDNNGNIHQLYGKVEELL